MGRAARNHGGTGGHGCFPLPGERPNFNHHIITDKALLSLVQGSNRIKQNTNGVEIKPKGQGFKKEVQVSVNSLKPKLTSVELRETSDQLPSDSAQLPATPIQTTLTPVNLPVAQVPLASTQLSMTSCQQLMPSGQLPVTSAKPLVDSVELPMTSIQPPVTSVKMSVTSVQLPLTNKNPRKLEQMAYKTQPSIIEQKEMRLIGPGEQTPQFMDSADHRVQQKQTVDSVPQKVSSVQSPIQLPIASVQDPVSAMQPSVPSESQQRASLKHPVPSDQLPMSHHENPFVPQFLPCPTVNNLAEFTKVTLRLYSYFDLLFFNLGANKNKYAWKQILPFLNICSLDFISYLLILHFLSKLLLPLLDPW